MNPAYPEIHAAALAALAPLVAMPPEQRRADAEADARYRALTAIYAWSWDPERCPLEGANSADMAVAFRRAALHARMHAALRASGSGSP